MRIGAFEAEVLIEGQPAKEYIDDKFEQDAAGTTMSKYIQAIPGANFAFRLTVLPGYEFAPAIDFLSIGCLVDGRCSGIRQVLTKSDTSMTRIRKGFVTRIGGRLKEQKFRFSALDTYGF